MTDCPFAFGADTAKRAAGVPGAIAADLSLLGGVLRCETCGGERSLDDIAGHLTRGWPSHCGHVMTWVTLKELAAEARDVPDGFELAAVVSDGWRLETGKLCVRKAGRQTCRMPSVAALNRGQHRNATDRHPARAVDAWWPYCISHLHGHWIQDGQVMNWVLREVQNPVAEPREDDELWRCWARGFSTGRRSLSRTPATRRRRPPRCRTSGRTSR